MAPAFSNQYGDTIMNININRRTILATSVAGSAALLGGETRAAQSIQAKSLTAEPAVDPLASALRNYRHALIEWERILERSGWDDDVWDLEWARLVKPAYEEIMKEPKASSFSGVIEAMIFLIWQMDHDRPNRSIDRHLVDDALACFENRQAGGSVQNGIDDLIALRRIMEIDRPHITFYEPVVAGALAYFDGVGRA